MHYGACHATKGLSDFHTIKEGNKKQEQNIIHHWIREREREAKKMKMKALTAALGVVVLLCCLDVAFGYNPYYAGIAGTVYHTQYCRSHYCVDFLKHTATPVCYVDSSLCEGTPIFGVPPYVCCYAHDGKAYKFEGQSSCSACPGV